MICLRPGNSVVDRELDQVLCQIKTLYRNKEWVARDFRHAPPTRRASADSAVAGRSATASMQ